MKTIKIELASSCWQDFKTFFFIKRMLLKNFTTHTYTHTKKNRERQERQTGRRDAAWHNETDAFNNV